ncbi:hypothetical protein GS399_07635 [Pedobacter sp. HMF7647]|uniref:Periplasmic heavy metal sensor n=1 Tax=Hufsiella arboris TaxID=2695275 RepID=A0A7K1Y8C5_9SPHI|nr:hypothetical protein [Hufsiella arboris]MXV50842.1 hypothetical protein [Hufsiella arboris]
MKIRFTIYMLLIMATFNALTAFSQPGQRKQIDQLKYDYISRRLELTPQQTRDFLPVYQSYQNELNGLLQDRRQNQKNFQSAPDRNMDDELAFEGKVLDVRKRYKNEFQRVLPPDKIALFFKAEREFREQLIQELRQRRQ